MPPLKSRPNRNPNPSPGLNVIALISGGKDSLYSILHCIRNGHRVVALANLHPPLSNTTTTGIGTSTIHNDPSRGSGRSSHGGEKPKGEDEEVPGEVEERSGADDIDSFMYQTIGWGVIPLYEAALGIPLYRAPIAGGAVDKGRVYRDRPDPGSDSDSDPGPSACSAQKATGHEEEEEDETESLIPLLRRIMQAHPEANAVCAGAILSTYQRTRIEDVAARLGLTPLAWLWMYPFLPAPVERMSASPSASRPGDGGEAGLLEDMAAVGCSARIVKVASGGLDEGFLWGDVAGSESTGGSEFRGRIVKGMRRFVVGDSGEDIRGAVLGEGGEYETLAVDGPRFLWKGRIEIEEAGREVRVGEGGVAYLKLRGARAVPKEGDEGDGITPESVRRPVLLDGAFADALEWLWDGVEDEDEGSEVEKLAWLPANSVQSVNGGLWTVSNITAPEAGLGVAEQMEAIAEKVHTILDAAAQEGVGPRTTADIVFTTVLLRSMADFPLMNNVYVSLFKKPNPPARATVACGETLPEGVKVMLSLVIDLGSRAQRNGLHVQSRSYWAPANIGPYSQAMSVPLQGSERAVYIAGQIPLEPASMELADSQSRVGDPSWAQTYCLRAVLSLQHMWRIGIAMEVSWWLGTVAFFTGSEHMRTRARLAWKLWQRMHNLIEEPESEEESTVDVWDIKYGRQGREQAKAFTNPRLPNFDVLEHESDSRVPVFLAVQVHELPRNSDIEWQGMGYRCEGVKVTRTETEYGRTIDVITNENQRYSCIEVDGGAPEFDLKLLVHRAFEASAVSPRGSHCVIYSCRPVPQDSFPGQVVPCKSVWGADGRALAAGIIIQRQT